jgi:hypothetical protein
MPGCSARPPLPEELRDAVGIRCDDKDEDGAEIDADGDREEFVCGPTTALARADTHRRAFRRREWRGQLGAQRLIRRTP